jgi:hypothetical protein
MTRRRTWVQILVAVGLGLGMTLAVPALPAVGTHSPPTFAHDVEVREPVRLVLKGAAIIVPVEVTCGPGGTGFVSVEATQRRGSRVAVGFGDTQVACTGEPQVVDVLVSATNASFRKGDVLIEAHLFACSGVGPCQTDTDVEVARVR